MLLLFLGAVLLHCTSPHQETSKVCICFLSAIGITTLHTRNCFKHTVHISMCFRSVVSRNTKINKRNTWDSALSVVCWMWSAARIKMHVGFSSKTKSFRNFRLDHEMFVVIFSWKIHFAPRVKNDRSFVCGKLTFSRRMTYSDFLWDRRFTIFVEK